jgi:starvation-inducible outer membrane lipoprotein
MQRKKFLIILGTLITGMALVLAPAGCASAGSTKDSTAAELAADLNAIKAGSAKVNGATVTLTGSVISVIDRRSFL